MTNINGLQGMPATLIGIGMDRGRSHLLLAGVFACLRLKRVSDGVAFFSCVKRSIDETSGHGFRRERL